MNLSQLFELELGDYQLRGFCSKLSFINHVKNGMSKILNETDQMIYSVPAPAHSIFPSDISDVEKISVSQHGYPLRLFGLFSLGQGFSQVG